MANFKAYLQTLLSRFVSKSAEDTQFVGNLDWGRMIDLSSSFSQVGSDFETNYTTPESGVCLLSVGALVEGIFITDKTQTVNMMCVGNPQIWPAISCVVSKGKQITFSIRHPSFPATQAVFVPFARAS